jgi:hypothetical protein
MHEADLSRPLLDDQALRFRVHRKHLGGSRRRFESGQGAAGRRRKVLPHDRAGELLRKACVTWTETRLERQPGDRSASLQRIARVLEPVGRVARRGGAPDRMHLQEDADELIVRFALGSREDLAAQRESNEADEEERRSGERGEARVSGEFGHEPLRPERADRGAVPRAVGGRVTLEPSARARLCAGREDTIVAYAAPRNRAIGGAANIAPAHRLPARLL